MDSQKFDVPDEIPRRSTALIFLCKVLLLRQKRKFLDLGHSKRFSASSAVQELETYEELRSALWSTGDPAELALEMGKVHNLRVAARQLNGIVIPAGQTFSFWRQVGPPVKRRGFVEGRALVQGCIVPSTGGGLCQLSNAIYELGLRCGYEIVERHAHSRAVPRSTAKEGRDATVAWNYVDLRFRPQAVMRLEAFLTQDELVVRFHRNRELARKESRPAPANLRLIQDPLRSCESCGLSDCFRHNLGSAGRARAGRARKGFLLDGVWPEYQKRLLEESSEGDVCFVPTQLKAITPARYAWELPLGSQVRSASVTALLRSLHARRSLSPPALRAQGLKDTKSLADAYAAQLDPSQTELVIDSSLLGPLFERGELGGRSYSVWLTQIPLKILHEHLDEAAKIYPNRPRLSDFRASQEEVERQWQALISASRIVTPHIYLAKLLESRISAKIDLIPWELPTLSSLDASDEGYVFFAGPTAAREGALAMKEAAIQLGLKVSLGGRNLEENDFWDGCEILEAATHPMSRARVVVCAALLKNRPYECLRALALEKALITTPGCGVAADRLVPFGDAAELVTALRSVGQEPWIPG